MSSAQMVAVASGAIWTSTALTGCLARSSSHISSYAFGRRPGASSFSVSDVLLKIPFGQSMALTGRLGERGGRGVVCRSGTARRFSCICNELGRTVSGGIVSSLSKDGDGHLALSVGQRAAAVLCSLATCHVLSPSSAWDPTSASAHAAQGSGVDRPYLRRRSAVGTSRDMATVVENEPVEVLIKAATGHPDLLGDCPFSQRVTLTLEEKHVKYVAKYIDTSNKPSWFLEINPEGKVPVIKHQDKWVADSDVIVGIIEKEYPEPSLAVPEEKSSVGSKIFGSFVKFLKSKDPSDGTEAALLEELKSFDDHLAKEGPFVNGDKISSVDMSLIPKLYHLRVALKHFKNWTIPAELKHVHDYIKATEARESFKKTAAAEDTVIAGWEKHLSQ